MYIFDYLKHGCLYILHKVIAEAKAAGPDRTGVVPDGGPGKPASYTSFVDSRMDI